MNIRDHINFLKEYSYISGLCEVIDAAMDGENECIFTIIVCEDDDIAPRKIVDEYEHIGLNASWEKCDLATYKVGDDVVSKYFIRVTW